MTFETPTEHLGPPPRPTQPWHHRFGLGAAGFEATKRAFFLGFLTLVLLIPLSMIEDLVQERGARKFAVDSEITGQWGRAQTLLGPILVVPYRYVSEASDTGSPRMATSQLFFLPKHLAVATDVKAERRAKSIYEVLVYGGTANLTGDFVDLTRTRADIAPEMIDWSGARILVGIADPAAIRSMSLKLGDQPPATEDSVQHDASLSSSLAWAAPLTAAVAAKPLPFAQ